MKTKTDIKYRDDDNIIKRVVIDEYDTIYPYKHRVRIIYAIPVNKHSKKYLKVKAKLGDDWHTDITNSWFDLNHPMKFKNQEKLDNILKNL